MSSGVGHGLTHPYTSPGSPTVADPWGATGASAPQKGKKIRKVRKPAHFSSAPDPQGTRCQGARSLSVALVLAVYNIVCIVYRGVLDSLNWRPMSSRSRTQYKQTQGWRRYIGYNLIFGIALNHRTRTHFRPKDSASKSGHRCWQAIADSHTPASGRNALAEGRVGTTGSSVVRRATLPERAHLSKPTWACPFEAAYLSVPIWGCLPERAPWACPPERAHLSLPLERAYLSVPTWACHLSVPTWACPPELATWACLPERAHLSVPTWACPLERAYLSVPTWACLLERAHLSLPTWANPLEWAHLSVPTWACPCTLAQRLFIPRYVALCLTRWYSMLRKSYPKAINSIKFWGPN